MLFHSLKLPKLRLSFISQKMRQPYFLRTLYPMRRLMPIAGKM